MSNINAFFKFFARQIEKKPPETFGQKRAEQLSERLGKALDTRRKLFRAEFAVDEPLKTLIAQRGHLEERRIDRFKAQIEEAKK